ncbi:MAG: glycosyltransferase family 39 protein [Saprospiraceae bacterium]
MNSNLSAALRSRLAQVASRPGLTLLTLLAAAVLLRFPSFFVSVINHDESTYIVIADEMLRGKTYWVDVFDTKPPGIFLIYALLIQLTFGSIFGLRLAAALVVGLTGWVLFHTGRRVTGDASVGWVAGFGYVFATGIFTYYGVSPNTELFFNLFTSAALLVLLRPRGAIVSDTAYSSALPSPLARGWGRGPSLQPFERIHYYFAAGLLLGLGFCIKPMVLAETAALGLWMLYRIVLRRHWKTGLLQAVPAMAVGFLLPYAAVMAYYYFNGEWDNYAFWSLEVPGRYPAEKVWYMRLKFMGDFLLRYSPFVITAGLAAWYRRARDREFQLFLLAQFLLVTVVITMPGKSFGHYQVQLFPPLMLAAGLWFAHYRSGIPGRRAWQRWGPAVFGLLFLTFTVINIVNYAKKMREDGSREVAAYLQPLLRPGELVFAANSHQIIYHLLDRPVPTPYVHSSLLYYAHHQRAMRIDPAAEAHRIVNNPALQYVVGRPARDTGIITDSILTYFHPIHSFGGKKDLILLQRNAE